MAKLSVIMLALLLTACSGSPPPAANLYIAQCLQGCPEGTPLTNEVLVRHLYAVSINAESRLADWVSYRIVPGSIGVASLLPREWQDDQLSRHGVRLADLQGSGATLTQPASGDQPESAYRVSEFALDAGERGRLVPMSSFAATSYWPDLNLLSILSFMNSDLRLGPWARLDQAINQLVSRDGELYVVTGPVAGEMPGTGSGSSEPVRFSGFFKIVASDRGEVAAFLFPQDLPVHGSFCNGQAELADVQALTGLRFFPRSRDWPAGSLAGRLGCQL